MPGPPAGGEEAAAHLCLDGREVASYVWRPSVPLVAAPRPYLHPVRTLGGTEVTEFMPADHVHHMGASLALPDVDGHNFWGGRTYLRGQGPTMLDNHGVQRHAGWTLRTSDELVQALSWLTRAGDEVLREERGLAARSLDATSWALRLAFAVTNIGPAALTIGSPATNGRPGAGYGGFFWRAPGTSTALAVFGPGADGEDAVHGSRSPWLALTGVAARPAGTAGRVRPRLGPVDGWTLVFLPGDRETGQDPWFVRTRDYPGIGSSLAWERPLVLAPGGVLRRSFVVVVADGVLSRDRVGTLAAATGDFRVNGGR